MNVDMDAVVVDVQGFYDQAGEFIPKEIAIMCVEKFRVQHYIVKPPYHKTALPPKTIKANDWVEAFYVGINWEEGFIDYDELPRLIVNNTKPYSLILVKGQEKADYLTTITERHIINLENLGCPSLKTLDTHDVSCLHEVHRNTTLNCALRNTHQLVLWCTANKDVVNLLDANTRLKTFDGFPIPFIHPLEVAEAGFYYVKREEYCQCVFCSLTIRTWTTGDLPLEVHKRWKPSCKYVCSVAETNLSDASAPTLKDISKEGWRFFNQE
jgi:Inhibitor of Apoptosis domain